jgi:hypothetical protein
MSGSAWQSRNRARNLNVDTNQDSKLTHEPQQEVESDYDDFDAWEGFKAVLFGLGLAILVIVMLGFLIWGLVGLAAL